MINPLFPINSLVCPGGRIPVQVFESRYLDMVSHSLKTDTGFVVVMLREEKKSSGKPNCFYDVGTLVKVVDFATNQHNGVLNLTLEGLFRVNIESPCQQDDGLWLGKAIEMASENFVSLPKQYEELKTVLKALVKHPLVEELNMKIDFQDGRQVGLRLAELLPLGNRQKQYLFELEDPIFRLEEIAEQLSAMVV